MASFIGRFGALPVIPTFFCSMLSKSISLADWEHSLYVLLADLEQLLHEIHSMEQLLLLRKNRPIPPEVASTSWNRFWLVQVNRTDLRGLFDSPELVGTGSRLCKRSSEIVQREFSGVGTVQHPKRMTMCRQGAGLTSVHLIYIVQLTLIDGKPHMRTIC